VTKTPLILVGARDPLPPDHRYSSHDALSVYFACQPRSVWDKHAHRQIQVTVGFSPARVGTTVTAASAAQPAMERWGSGDFVSIVPAGHPHSTDWRRKADLMHLYLDPGFVARAAHEFQRDDDIEVIGHYLIRDPLIERLADQLRGEMREGAPSRLYFESLATVLAVQLRNRYAARPENPRQLKAGIGPYRARRALDYIEAHLHDNALSLNDMAADLGMSPHYFAELFKNRFGVSPYRYVLSRRIEQARVLLAARERSLADIALELGFGSQSRFTTVFVQRMGTTPAAYRRSF
jgi:AraC family transcriptional regulator